MLKASKMGRLGGQCSGLGDWSGVSWSGPAQALLGSEYAMTRHLGSTRMEGSGRTPLHSNQQEAVSRPFSHKCAPGGLLLRGFHTHSWSLTTTLSRKGRHFPHFADGKTEEQQGPAPSPRSQESEPSLPSIREEVCSWVPSNRGAGGGAHRPSSRSPGPERVASPQLWGEDSRA